MNHLRKKRQILISHEELSLDEEDQLLQMLHRTIRASIRVLAVFMVFTILWGPIEVVWLIYQKLIATTFTTSNIRDIATIFSGSLAPIVAIAIFKNITLYIRKDLIHIKLVLATALMAMARKVIIFDFSTIPSLYVFGIAAAVMALGISYWLIDKQWTLE